MNAPTPFSGSRTRPRAAPSRALVALAALASPSGVACRRPTPAASAAGAGPPTPIESAGEWAGLRVRTAGERTRPRQAVILMHGWGAPGTDLVSLARPLEAPGRLFVFPEGPLVSPGGGRAWWHIDMARLLSARQQGRERELRQETPSGLGEARARIAALVAEVSSRTGLPASAIVLGGFSQGAMLATDVALTSPEPIGALVILSGSIVDERAWSERLQATKPMFPVFMSHGTVDPVLPFGIAEALREQLRAAHRDVTWVPFDDGHGIPLEVLTKLTAFLSTANSVTPPSAGRVPPP